MTDLKPTDKVVAWKCKHARERIMSCVAMLNMHGFMTAAERRKIGARVIRWLGDEENIDDDTAGRADP